MDGMPSWYCNPAARDWTGPDPESRARAFHASMPGVVLLSTEDDPS
jgi:hypothetical protein